MLRTISIVDQIFIKALLIRTIHEKKEQRLVDDIDSDFKVILNYSVIVLIQMKLYKPAVVDVDAEHVGSWYYEQVTVSKKIMLDKNHDYGEAWREMSQESFADLILVKLLRIKQILQNDGRTLISEGIDANYVDILNYAVFALILIAEGKH